MRQTFRCVLALSVACAFGIQAVAAQTCGDLQDTDFVLTASGSAIWWTAPSVTLKPDTASFSQNYQGVGQTVTGLSAGERLYVDGKIHGDVGAAVVLVATFRDAAGTQIGQRSREETLTSNTRWVGLDLVTPPGADRLEVYFAPGTNSSPITYLGLTRPCAKRVPGTTQCGYLNDPNFLNASDGTWPKVWSRSNSIVWREDTAQLNSAWLYMSQDLVGFNAGQEFTFSWRDSAASDQTIVAYVRWYDEMYNRIGDDREVVFGNDAWTNHTLYSRAPANAVWGGVQLSSGTGVSAASPVILTRPCLQERVYAEVSRYTTLDHLSQHDETYTRGLAGVSGSQTINVPNSAQVESAQIVVYFAGAAPSQGDNVYAVVDGNAVLLSRKLINRSASSPALVYSAEVVGPVASVVYSNTLALSGVQAMTVTARRRGVAGVSEGGVFALGFQRGTPSASVRISLAPSFESRDVEVSIPLGRLANDGSVIDLDLWTSSTNHVYPSFTLGSPGVTVDAQGLATLRYTFANVGANRTYIYARVIPGAGSPDVFYVGPIRARNVTTSGIVIEGYGACTGSFGNEMFPEGDFGTYEDLGGTMNIAPYDSITWGPPPSGVVAPGYNYVVGDAIRDGEYAIVTSTWGHYQINSGVSGRDSWVVSEDHGPERDGYAMLVNASYDPGLFFYKRINNLCANTTYNFSVAIKNVDNPIMRPNNPVNPGPPYEDVRILPDIDFVLAPVGASAFDLETIPASYSSGPIMNDGDWHIEGFSFSMPPGVTSVVLAIRNNAPGGGGNDLLLDDISFRPCGPATVLGDVRPWCSGAGEVFLDNTRSGTYPSPVYQWQYSTNYAASWADVPGATGTNLSPGLVNAGTMYRLRTAGSATNLNNDNCAVLSENYVVPNGDCVEDCTNGVDDDLDGLVDCDDPDCASKGACPCATGRALVEVWRDQPGGRMVDLTSDPRYPGLPDLRLHTPWLALPANTGNTFGAQMSGWIIPPTTGTYVFNVTGDDAFDASLSSGAMPGTEVRIAYSDEWTRSNEHTKYATQTSGGIALVAGKQYYFQVRSKENYGGDHLQLYWQRPGDTGWSIVSGSYLASYAEGCAVEDCTNGIDDDGDGLIDECDAECPSRSSVLRVNR